MTMKDKLDEYGGFLDVGILSHGFAPHMRDYDIVFEALCGKEQWADAKGTYRLRFSHCPETTTTTTVEDAGWRKAWPDTFIDYSKWLAEGEPEGFVWGACCSTAYQGLRYIDDSPRAKRWSERLGSPMHEVSVATEAFEIRIVFHDFTVTKLDDTVRVLDKVMFPLKPPADEEGGKQAAAAVRLRWRLSGTALGAPTDTLMQNPRVQLRPLTVADIPTVLALWRSCEGVGMSESDAPVHLATFLARNPGMSWTAVAEGGVVGAVLSGHDGRRGFLYHLAVHPTARRMGIGRQLVDEALRGLKSVGILKCQIVVFQVNDDARRFWSRLGWTLREDLYAYSKAL